jgi:hypothetical protein
MNCKIKIRAFGKSKTVPVADFVDDAIIPEEGFERPEDVGNAVEALTSAFGALVESLASRGHLDAGDVVAISGGYAENSELIFGKDAQEKP